METLNLETCRAIGALGVSGEAEKWWHRSWNPEKKVENELYVMYDPYNKAAETDTPAYSFSELLNILPQIGEKLGWRVAGVGNRSEWQTQAHFLLDAYLTGKMPAVDAELLKLLKAYELT